MDYLIDQFTIGSSPDLGSQAERQEKVYNFVQVPFRLEKLILFGAGICLSSLMFHLIVLPMRVLVGLVYLALRYVFVCVKRILLLKSPLHVKFFPRPSQLQECIKVAIVIVTLMALEFLDLSCLYHSIRVQNIVKLYVIYNVCEIADKLCCSFGLDVLNAVTSNSKFFNPLVNSTIAVIYCVFHSTVLIYQIVTLNVAINSHSNALLTLLLSNQFVEIKSAVFKKFEKENLFQLSCSEMVERVYLLTFCLLIGIRNGLQLEPYELDNFLSFCSLIYFPFLVVYLSEVMIDWLKHCFITKFNSILPQIYSAYYDVLCNDISVHESRRNIVEYSSRFISVASKIGFSPIPLCVIIYKIVFQLIGHGRWRIFASGYLLLFLAKIFLDLLLYIVVVDNTTSTVSVYSLKKEGTTHKQRLHRGREL